MKEEDEGGGVNWNKLPAKRHMPLNETRRCSQFGFSRRGRDIQKRKN